MLRRLIGTCAIGLLFLAGCTAHRTEINKETVRRMISAIDARDFKALDGLVAANVRRHSAATPTVAVESLAQFKEFLRQDQLAIPDSKQEIKFMLAEDDLVALYAVYRGTQRGQMGPYPPSGRRVELPFLAILRLKGGKIAEMWVEWDNLNVLTQIGQFPPSGGAPDRPDR